MSESNNPAIEGGKATDKALERFTDLLIEKIKNLQTDWKKPWFSEAAVMSPRNLSGRYYGGMNALMLSLHAEKQGYKLPIFCTFDRVASMNFTKDKGGKTVPATDKEGSKLPHIGVNKGEKSFPVFLTVFSVVNPETKERISYDDYKKLSEDEKNKYKVFPKLQTYNVFAVEQTNMKEARPDLYAKLEEMCKVNRPQHDGKVTVTPAVDKMIQDNLWICPIKEVQGDDAYYSISKKEIVVPKREQFIDGESFESNLYHEMAHSTGADDLLARIKPSSFGSDAYAREELVAELSAAVTAAHFGLAKHVKEDSAAYLKSWLENLNQSPDYLKTTLFDVKRASNMLIQNIEKVQLQIDLEQQTSQTQEKTESPVKKQELNEDITLDVPAWAVNYIVNADPSGLSDDEVKMVDDFIDKNFPDGFIPDVVDNSIKELNFYPAFGARNENALPNRGESPYLGVKTVEMTFSPPGYFETRNEKPEIQEETVAKQPSKVEEAEEQRPHWHR